MKSCPFHEVKTINNKVCTIRVSSSPDETFGATRSCIIEYATTEWSLSDNMGDCCVHSPLYTFRCWPEDITTNESIGRSKLGCNRIHNFNKKIKYNTIVYLRSLNFQYCTPPSEFHLSRRRIKSRRRSIHSPALSPKSLQSIPLWFPCSTDPKITYDNFYKNTRMWTNMVFKYSYI